MGASVPPKTVGSAFSSNNVPDSPPPYMHFANVHSPRFFFLPRASIAVYGEETRHYSCFLSKNFGALHLEVSAF